MSKTLGMNFFMLLYKGSQSVSYYLVLDGVGLEAPIHLTMGTTNKKVPQPTSPLDYQWQPPSLLIHSIEASPLGPRPNQQPQPELLWCTRHVQASYPHKNFQASQVDITDSTHIIISWNTVFFLDIIRHRRPQLTTIAAIEGHEE